MRFFVPYASNRAEAEEVWTAVRLWLSDMGLPTTRRRIRALALEIDGVDHKVAVGEDTPDGDFVLAILEASDIDFFYVCTPHRGVLEGPPYSLWLDERWRVIDFDEEVAGHA